MLKRRTPSFRRRLCLYSGTALGALVGLSSAAEADCAVSGTAALVSCDAVKIKATTAPGTGTLTVTDQTSWRVELAPAPASSAGHDQTLTLSGHTVIDTTNDSDPYSAITMFSDVADRNATVNIGKDVSLTTNGGGFGAVWVRNETSGNISITNAGTVLDTFSDGIHGTSNSGTVSIVNSGTVTETSADGRGLYADGTGNGSNTEATASVVNSGTVTAYARAIRVIAYDGLASLDNSGTATAQIRQALVAWSSDGDARIVNSGTASAADDHALHAMTETGDITVVNSGTLISSDDTGHVDAGTGHTGLRAEVTTSGDIAITNSGRITALAGEGIYADTPSGDVSIVNSGSVSAASGIVASGSSGAVSITNSGSIAASGAAGHGISVSSAAASVVNSGSVTASGAGSYAIAFSGSGNTLTLLDGTSLSGTAADLNLGGGTEVRVGVNRSAHWTYDGTLSGLSSFGTMVAVDAGDAIVAASTSSVSQASAIDASRGLAVASMLSRVAQQSAAPSVRVGSTADVELPATPQWTAWAMGYGERSHRGAAETEHFSSSIWGTAIGLDRHLDDQGTTAGLFVGRDESRADLDGGSHRIKAQNAYLGVRAGHNEDAGLFWNAAGMAGIGDVTSRRQVEGVADLARYSTDMQFADLVAGLGYHQILGIGFGATYSGRVNYGLRRIEGYTEDVGGVALDVDDRTSQSVGGRVQTSLDFWGPERRWQASPYVGLEGWRGIGGDSTDIRFGGLSRSVTDDTSSNLGVVVGLDAAWRFEDGLKLSAIVEGRRDRDGTTATQGFLQASLPF